MKVLAFAVLFCAVLAKCGDVLAVKDEKSRISSFYDEEKDSLDAVFIGSSHMFVTAYPFQLWEEYGIKSAVLGGNGMGVPLAYYCVKEAIREQHPQVIVVDLYKAYQDRKLDSLSFTHNLAEAVPHSVNRVQMLYDLIPKENRTEFCFPLYLYHSRWKELTQADFEEQACYTKGAAPQFHVYDAEGFKEIPEEEKQETPDMALAYIKKMIRECRENDVELIFTVIPYETKKKTDYQQRIFNGLADVLADQDTEYYNFFHMMDDVGLDVKTDFYDDAHVNYEGGKKITAYFGKLLSAKGLGRKDRDDGRWEEDARAWHAQVRNKQIKTIVDKEEYLDFISEGEYDYIFMVKDADVFAGYFGKEAGNCVGKLPDGKSTVIFDEGKAEVYPAKGGQTGIAFNGMWVRHRDTDGKVLMIDKESYTYSDDIKVFVYDEELDQLVDVAGINHKEKEITR